MNVQNLSRHLRLIGRAELLAIHAKLDFVIRRTLLISVALLIAGIGVVFVNIGLFTYLNPLWGPVWAPMGLGLINIVLALGALLAAAMLKPGPELALAEELRSLAGESLEAEITSATPLSIPGLLLPTVTTIISAVRRHRKEKG
jgi:hypothetical protein